MNDDELMFNKYKKYVAEWAKKAIRGDRVISFEEWKKRISDGRSALVEMVNDTRVDYVSCQFDVTKLAIGMGYLDEEYKAAYLIMNEELLGLWTASSKVHFNLYVNNYHAASWKYDVVTGKVEKEGHDEHDFLEFIMDPEVCRMFIWKGGIDIPWMKDILTKEIAERFIEVANRYM